jgi:hypothetical protein
VLLALDERHVCSIGGAREAGSPGLKPGCGQAPGGGSKVRSADIASRHGGGVEGMTRKQGGRGGKGPDSVPLLGVIHHISNANELQ